jgi:hypothetical protein
MRWHHGGVLFWNRPVSFSKENILKDEKGNKDNVEEKTEANKFDLAALRLSQDYGNAIGVKKALVTVPVRKPGRQDFVRVHPDPSFRLETAVIEVKDENETYLVAPHLWSGLPTELSPKILLTAINRQGVLFIWPVRLPGTDGKSNPWNDSALHAAKTAMKRWIRLASNRSLGAYEIYEAAGDLADPVWPDVSFQKIMDIAFKDHYIDSVDDPVIKRLLGQI